METRLSLAPGQNGTKKLVTQYGERLVCVREGRTREDALKLTGCALVSEVYGIMKSLEPYDNARYVANLKRLPELPWSDEE